MNLAFNSLSKIRSLKVKNIDGLSDIKNLSGLLPEGGLKDILDMADENKLMKKVDPSKVMQFEDLYDSFKAGGEE